MKYFVMVMIMLLAVSTAFADNKKVELTFTEEEHDTLQAKATELEFESIEAYLKALVDKLSKVDRDMPIPHPMIMRLQPVSPAVAAKRAAAHAAWEVEEAKRIEEEAKNPKPAKPATVTTSPDGRPVPPKGPFASDEERMTAWDEFLKARRAHGQ